MDPYFLWNGTNSTSILYIFDVCGLTILKNVMKPGVSYDVHSFKTFFKTFILMFVSGCTLLKESLMKIIIYFIGSRLSSTSVDYKSLSTFVDSFEALMQNIQTQQV